MDTKKLEYIIAIANEGSISKAAEHMYITRSALNYALLNLEQELGVTLFKRFNHKLTPTTAGDIYLKYAHQILDLASSCDAELKDIVGSTNGNIHVGITPGYGQAMFTAVYPEFYKKYPKYDIHLMEGNARALYRYLKEGKIDFAWCAFHKYDKDLEHFVLRKERVYLAVPLSLCKQPYDPNQLLQPVFADLSLYKSNRFILMNKNSIIRDITDIYFSNAGFNPHVLFEGSVINMVRSIINSGAALSFFPMSMCQPGYKLAYYPMEKAEEFGVSISYRKNSYLSVADQFFIQLIKQSFSSILEPPANLL